MELYRSRVYGTVREFPDTSLLIHGDYGDIWDRVPSESPSALSEQVGGNHYKGMAIQPIIYIHNNGLGYLEGNVIKYISRHKLKGGKDDVLKAIHYCNLILELEYAK